MLTSVVLTNWLVHTFDLVGILSRYSNRPTQVTALETLLADLPSLEEPVAEVPRTSWRRVRRLSESEVDQLVADYQAGRTVYELAAQFGINRKVVSKHLHARGVTMRMRGLSPTQIDQAVRLYGEGASLATIGCKLGVDAGTVHARLRERGVRMRDTQGRER